MKTLSLKLDDHIFDDAEEMTSKLNLARNRYINEAVNIYNIYNKGAMDVLREFEKLVDGN
jgi:hypothetical protein